MKVRSTIKKLCPHCKLIHKSNKEWKKKIAYIKCEANPRHNQRRGFCNLSQNFMNFYKMNTYNFPEIQIQKMDSWYLEASSQLKSL
mmetsp:Transcript_7486/g.6811  ORF Transcript_7486/g.6811 Transcript_7486/m.6811 type:complete len:86 (-) Transcript_7486:57-314(-)